MFPADVTMSVFARACACSAVVLTGTMEIVVRKSSVFGFLIYSVIRLANNFVTLFIKGFVVPPMSFLYDFSLYHCTVVWSLVLCVETTSPSLNHKDYCLLGYHSVVQEELYAI